MLLNKTCFYSGLLHIYAAVEHANAFLEHACAVLKYTYAVLEQSSGFQPDKVFLFIFGAFLPISCPRGNILCLHYPKN